MWQASLCPSLPIALRTPEERAIARVSQDGRYFGLMVREPPARLLTNEETQPMNTPTNLPAIPLPSGIRSRFVEGINGLRMHVLEAGFETQGRPCVLLLHGFPELSYSWRKVMPALAAAGYHVIAPDQRG